MADIKPNGFLQRIFFDPFEETKQHARPGYAFKGGQIWMMAPLVIGVVLLAISGISWSQDPTQFYFSYLVG